MSIIRGDVSIEMLDKLLANKNLMPMERTLALDLRKILENILPARDGIKDLKEGEKEARRELKTQRGNLPAPQRKARTRHIRTLRGNIKSMEHGIESDLQYLERGISKLNRLARIRESSSYRPPPDMDRAKWGVWLLARQDQPKTNKVVSSAGALIGLGTLVGSVVPIVLLGVPLVTLGATVPLATIMGGMTWWASTFVDYRNSRVFNGVIPLGALREWQKAQRTGLFDEFVVVGDWRQDTFRTSDVLVLCGVVYESPHYHIHFRGSRIEGTESAEVVNIPGDIFEITRWSRSQKSSKLPRGKFIA